MAAVESGLEVIPDPRSLPEYHEPQDSKILHYNHGQKEVLEPEAAAAPGDGNSTSLQRSEIGTGRRMSPAVFGILVAAAAAIIVGVPLGVGLGSALIQARDSATCTRSSAAAASSTLAAATTTNGGQLVNYTAASAATVFSVPLNCPDLDRTTYNTYNAQSWSVSCQRAAWGNDLVAVLAYSYADCIEACATMNEWQKNSSTCVAVQFDARMSNNTGRRTGKFGNCWLKRSAACWRAGDLEQGLSARLVGHPAAQC